MKFLKKMGGCLVELCKICFFCKGGNSWGIACYVSLRHEEPHVTPGGKGKKVEGRKAMEPWLCKDREMTE